MDFLPRTTHSPSVTAHMTFKQKLGIISTILLVSSCTTKQTDLEFEKAVLYEIFPALMDSTNIDLRLSPPPPPRPIFDENDSLIGVDTTGMKKLREDYEKRKSQLESDSVKLFIAVIDSAYILEVEEKQELLDYFEDEKIVLDSTSLSKEYKIDINKLVADDKLRFIYRSELPEGSEMWREKYDLAGSISISRIQFDQSRTFGMLNSGYGCGRLCGGGARIFIKKVNGKWIIQELVGTWVS